MKVRSMTGYGRGERTVEGWRVSVELRSVNHRGLDLRFVAPPSLNGVEPEARRLARDACHRGRLECRLSVEAPPPEAVSAETLAQAESLYATLVGVRNHLDLAPPIGLRDLMAAGLDLHPSASSPPEGLESAAIEAIREGLVALTTARAVEGEGLRDDFRQRLERVGGLVEEVEALSAVASAAFRDDFGRRLREAVDDLGVEGLDLEQLKQELANLLDKSDITEEIVRARAHTQQLIEMLAGDEPADGPAGKRIDFFLQELIRESNTMASKSMSAELTARVVDIKVEVERMREQAYNIE